jgi:hypothetical protein
MADAPHPDPHANPAAGHEASDASVGAILWFAGLLAAVVVVVQLALWGMFVLLRDREDQEKRSRFPLSATLNQDLEQTRFGSPVVGKLPPPPRLEGINLDRWGHDVGRDRVQGTAKTKNDEDEAQLKSSDHRIEKAMKLVAEEYKPKGREPGPVRYDVGIPGTGGGSNSGRTLPEAKR